MKEKFEICAPINSLVEYLEQNGCVVIEQKVSDYHFHEMYIQLQTKNLKSLKRIEVSIEGIEKIENNKFTCNCHWSTVEVLHR